MRGSREEAGLGRGSLSLLSLLIYPLIFAPQRRRPAVSEQGERLA